jgi:uncharacterized phiE125 gp8 family phage protein
VSLELVTAPTLEIVTLAEAKDHLFVLNEDYDAYIQTLLAAAQEWVGVRLRQSLVTTTWRQRLDCWPACGVIELYRPPLASVTSVKYYNDAGTEVTWSSANYTVDTTSMPGRILRGYGVTWPTLRYEGVASPITIEYVAGRATVAEVPAVVKHALKLLVGHWFKQREEVSATSVNQVPVAVESLLAKAAHGSYP